MRVRRLLAGFLLGVGLCFVPILGYGEVILGRKVNPDAFLQYGEEPWWFGIEALKLETELLRAQIEYMMYNPTTFIHVGFYYDLDGGLGKKFFPEGIHTKGKICVQVVDNRNVFYGKSRIALLDQFKKQLKVVYSFIDDVATDMNTDIVAKFSTREDIPLGYFYQGEYHLWEK